MFQGATVFNQDISGWNTSNVTNMSSMFDSTFAFNGNVRNWDVRNVTNMFSMFQGTQFFNQDISGWNTSSVTNMGGMFENAYAFNQNIGTWSIPRVTNMNSMLTNSAISINNFDNILNGWASQTGTTGLRPNVKLGAQNLFFDDVGVPGYLILTSTPNNWTINATYTCFKEGTKILTDKGYIPIENLKIDDLVLTYKYEYKAIKIIGNSKINHPAIQNNRIKNQLYVYKKEKNPELIEDLVITGGHSILLDRLSDNDFFKNNPMFGKEIYMIDNKYRLLSCIDENADVFEEPGIYNIYHLSLESEDENQAYGIYANGLLLESCSAEFLKKESKMDLTM